jgi:hypothetical protein
MVVAIIALAFVLSQSLMGNSTLSNSAGGLSETNSIEGGNQTYVANYVTSIATPTALTTFTTATSSSTYTSTPVASSSTQATSTQSLGSGNEFSYTPSSQVKVVSIDASVFSSQGSQLVVFSGEFENTGSGTIQVIGGGGSSLNVTTLGGSSILSQVSSPKCDIAAAMGSISPGQEWTATTPGCWSGFHYLLLGPGTIEVQLSLSWGGTSGPGTLVVSAEFTLG